LIQPVTGRQLVVKEIFFSAGARPLLVNLSFDISASQCVQVVGPNGVGKSTLLRLVAGLADPDEGTISMTLDGAPVAPSIRSQHILYQGHLPGFKNQFSVLENLFHQTELDGANYDLQSLGASMEHTLLDGLHQVGLKEQVNLAFGKLSAGQKQRCMLARLVINAKVLRGIKPLWVLDEPLNALDNDGQALVGELLNLHLGQGGSALVATHHDLETLGLLRTRALKLERAA
jgi:heme exporter protein A